MIDTYGFMKRNIILQQNALANLLNFHLNFLIINWKTVRDFKETKT